MAEQMTQAADAHPRPDGLTHRALNQMARELLLAQSSDWAFILKTQTHTAYVYRRLRDHLSRFSHLNESVSRHAIDEPWLTEREAVDNPFAFLDYRLYATTQGA
jgi:1,4-alpha-glucan branching enzyme